jgi:hypothetical protein
VGSDTELHVLHNKVSGAEVDESPALVFVAKQVAQKVHHLVFAVVLVDQVLLSLHELETLVKLFGAILTAHVLREIGKIAAGDVDHILLTNLVTRFTRNLGVYSSPVTVT